jgi:hypothetical protein
MRLHNLARMNHRHVWLSDRASWSAGLCLVRLPIAEASKLEWNEMFHPQHVSQLRASSRHEQPTFWQPHKLWVKPSILPSTGTLAMSSQGAMAYLRSPINSQERGPLGERVHETKQYEQGRAGRAILQVISTGNTSTSQTHDRGNRRE